jgi:hypothetical protein
MGCSLTKRLIKIPKNDILVYEELVGHNFKFPLSFFLNNSQVIDMNYRSKRYRIIFNDAIPDNAPDFARKTIRVLFIDDEFS